VEALTPEYAIHPTKNGKMMQNRIISRGLGTAELKTAGNSCPAKYPTRIAVTATITPG
jgi:hypothetical protein